VTPMRLVQVRLWVAVVPLLGVTKHLCLTVLLDPREERRLGVEVSFATAKFLPVLRVNSARLREHCSGVGCDEIDAALHQPAYEMNICCQAV
jgi:hypothetical protein